MKKFMKVLAENLNQFLEEKKQVPEMVENAAILRKIDLALRKKSSVHVIFSDKSFTGDIIKYDKDRQQLIIKNFTKNITTIIRIPDIQRISLVPKNIILAQKSDLKHK